MQREFWPRRRTSIRPPLLPAYVPIVRNVAAKEVVVNEGSAGVLAPPNFRPERILAEKTCCNQFGFSLSVRANAPFGALWVGRKFTQKR